MKSSQVLVLLLGTLIFYVVAVTMTYSSVAFYGALTLFLIVVSLLPLIVGGNDVLVSKSDKKKK